jgi:hypothetical protein
LARKKWFGARDGDCHISAAEFDELLGHCVAVTDAASSVFAVEMIEAYPDAKVVLNVRRDLDRWHEVRSRILWTWRIIEGFGSRIGFVEICSGHGTFMKDSCGRDSSGVRGGL